MPKSFEKESKNSEKGSMKVLVCYFKTGTSEHAARSCRPCLLFGSDGFDLLRELRLVLSSLDAEDGDAPSAVRVLVVVERRAGVLHDLGEVVLVLLLHVRERDARRVLLVHQLAEASLALHDRVRHVLLAAEGRQPDNQLDGLHVVSDRDELRLAALDQVSHVVQTVLDHDGLLRGGQGLVLLLRLLHRLRKVQAALLALLSLLRLHLAQQAEQVGSALLVESHLELVQSRGSFQTLHQNA